MTQNQDSGIGASIFWQAFSIVAAGALLVAPFMALLGVSWVLLILITVSLSGLASFGERWATTRRMEIGGVVAAEGRAAVQAGAGLIVACLFMEGAALGLVLWNPA